MADLQVRATARFPASLRTGNVTGFEARSMSRLFRLLFVLVLVPGPLFHFSIHRHIQNDACTTTVKLSAKARDAVKTVCVL